MGMCKKNYAPSGTLTASIGSSACATTGVITNCEYHYLSSSTTACYSCKSNYAVASTSTSCTSYTTDKNCRQLNSSGTCSYCWHAYYWNATVCKLASSIVALSLIVLPIVTLF